jgi:hypothetical protein
VDRYFSRRWKVWILRFKKTTIKSSTHYLKLSSKSIIHNWETVAAKGEVPELGKRIGQAAKMVKGANAVGWLAIGVDGIIAVDNIKEACTGNDTSQFEVVSYKETGGFAGSVGGGMAGGKIGAVTAVSLAVFLGVATGGVAIIAIGFIGAGVGAYGGSKGGDAFGEGFGETVYRFKKRYIE